MKIVLGSAQFADRYGISNNKSFISKKDLKKIFDLYKKKNNIIDTASNYKKSLETIASYNHKYKFKINLKIEIGNHKSHQLNFFDRLNSCFHRLKTKKIYSLMIHDTKNFMNLKKGEKKKIIDFLNNLKKIKKIDKIGYSIYDLNELKFLKKIKNIDLVQLPINIFDQDLIVKKKLIFLKKRKVEIHARSIFLQGLIFLKLPIVHKILGKKSSKIINFYKKFDTIDKRLFHSINFIKNCDIIDKAVVGFTNYLEFKKLLDIFETKKIKTNYNSFMIRDKRIIRPYLWRIKKIH